MIVCSTCSTSDSACRCLQYEKDVLRTAMIAVLRNHIIESARDKDNPLPIHNLMIPGNSDDAVNDNQYDTDHYDDAADDLRSQ